MFGIFYLLLNLFFLNAWCYDLKVADISVWLSAAAYCNRENYKSMKLMGPATNFYVDSVFHDTGTDIEGYIGKLDESIYVVFRGSSSVRNWIDDFEVIKDKYPYCNNCTIHSGFYKASQSLKNEIANSVGELIKKTKITSIIVTGHSLGAAMANVVSLDLFYKNMPNSVYNFGQPRVGNENFAKHSKGVIHNYWRFTHNKDIVPHVPPLIMDYYHSCGEIFENKSGKLNTCSITMCEDPNCAEQYKLHQTNGDDHEVYLNHKMNCESSAKI